MRAQCASLLTYLPDALVFCLQFDSTALEASIQEVRVANMQLKADAGKTVDKLRTLTQRLETLEKRPAQVIAARPSMYPQRYSETPPTTPPGALVSQRTAAPGTLSQLPLAPGRSMSPDKYLVQTASTAASAAGASAVTDTAGIAAVTGTAGTAGVGEPAASTSADAMSGDTSEANGIGAKQAAEASKAIQARRESETSASTSSSAADSASGECRTVCVGRHIC